MQYATGKCFKEFRNKLFPQKFQAYFPYCKMALKQTKKNGRKKEYNA